ncbi:MAG: TIGR01620 family protein [Pseudomonadota bacterium]
MEARDTPPAGPVLIELEPNTAQPDPADAPPVPDTAPPQGTAMQTVAALGARRRSFVGRLFWSALLALVGFVVSVAAWDFVTGLIARNTLLGGVALALIGAVLVALVAIALREAASIARLARLDGIHRAAETAHATGELSAARDAVDRLIRLYAARPETEWGRTRLAESRAEVLDAETLLSAAEAELLAPLDAAALREVEAAARQVATVTALVPLALADVVAALTANLRMIRRIAEIYGGRAGTLGAWRLTRTVLTHLVATGAVAVGDDLISSVAGGSLLSRISRRFGEGIVNGALTARVGVAALEVCRPLPYVRAPRPAVTGIVRRALTGLFGTDDLRPDDRKDPD